MLEVLWKVEGAVVRRSVEICFDHESCAPNSVIPKTVFALVEAKPDRVLQQEVRDTDGRTVLQTELHSLWVWRAGRPEIRTKISCLSVVTRTVYMSWRQYGPRL